MDVNASFKVEIENETFYKELNITKESMFEKLKTIAYGDLPELDKFISEYLKKDEDEIIKLLRISIALEIGKEEIQK
ncbi:hypothetical protein [Clostridium estertheticum]|uniref:hypothetical protein n=1 Tax=Clostridium estertheticum TaxID=238834 RepID=UPI001C7DAD9B|nr:hypothetical protein [Clostridium estertheticum]MBX4268445.1 hypothetical protein [Clostridium estertheticum]WLC81495.1 hypothetical protein KTC98_09930 [Clostridium estertheticum]